ncbi:MAG TPA: acetyl-CoA hydrolase/transferase C-terminal domain-containing protein [Anaerolineales bacterium]|nr:acetyl-CoA hydrolase/transferase C-terminal domain-containing protein [Anaerolineales bacterium]
MNWFELYRDRIQTAEEAVSRVQSHMRVFLTGNCSVPKTILSALTKRAPLLSNVEIVQVLTVGPADYVAPEMAGHLRVNTLFISDNVRGAVNEGRADFTPCFLSEIPGLFRSGALPLDVALIQVSPPDDHGFCSFGVEVGITKTAAQSAKLVIAEINPRMPRTLGDSFVHISKLNVIVQVDYALPEVHMAATDETTERIADHVASLIPNNATLQTGIGAIPDSVLKRLTNHKDLGVHTELFSDGVIDLFRRGVITGEKKTLHRGKMVAGFALGTQQLYDFVHDNPIVELHPSEYVNDPFVIAQNDTMVAINSAIEVDLTGQVCADSIGPRLYSGVGGQVDFIYGASRSKGGIPIIALPSTLEKKDGAKFSKIVPMLKPGAGVVTTRNHVHYIVTEYGVADLYGKTIKQRTKALIAIAAPEFREELEKKARELKYL